MSEKKEKKKRVLITIDKSIYSLAKQKSSNFSGLVEGLLKASLLPVPKNLVDVAKVAGSTPARPTIFTDSTSKIPLGETKLADFKRFLKEKNLSEGYQKDILKYAKSIYSKKEFKIDFRKKYDDHEYKSFLNLFQFLISENLLDRSSVEKLKEKIKVKKYKPDYFRPSDSDILHTLEVLKSRPKLRDEYILFLFSGIRSTEYEELRKKLYKIRKTTQDGFTKYYLNFYRHTKRSFIVYTPENLKISQRVTANALQVFLKRNNLIPVKYCRKWFFTKCIELGIPETIADFYEGRVGSSIGATHYLAREQLADKNYKKILELYYKFIDK